MGETLIKVQGVSKKFCRSLRRSLWYGVCDLTSEVLGREHDCNSRLREEEFWAIRDISFEVERGQCLGLVGRNGAGKTTLLKILNGLLRPDQGRIETRGRVGALIALGAGFNPLLTGRENIYVNAALLGLPTHEINAKFQQIVEFADIGEFIDAPVQNYSSGMQVRLGFAIATAIEPDILVLDEILAVGDAAFRFKCHRRIQAIMKTAAVIFVSHDMAHVSRISSRVLVLDKGQSRFFGTPAAGVETYRALNETAAGGEEGFITLKAPIRNFGAELDRRTIQPSAPLAVRLNFDSEEAIDNVAIRINVFNLAGDYAADSVTESSDLGLHVSAGRNSWQLYINAVPLRAGRYQISFSFADQCGDFLAVSHKCHFLNVSGGHLGTVADCQLKVTAATLTE